MTATQTTTMATSTPGPAAEQFAEKMLDVTNGGATALLLSLGHRAGLFEAMATMPPATSAQIAHATELSERYVREWLGGMVTAGVVMYDAQDGTYRLPEAHAACLTDDGAMGNMASGMQWFSVLGRVEDRVLESFRRGGGVCYEEFHRFHEVMASESAVTVVSALREHILPLVDGLIGQLQRGIRVLDIGCGRGRAVTALAQWYPGSTFTGYDMCQDAIDDANQHARKLGLTNLTFQKQDVSNLPADAQFELVTGFDVIHDQRDPARVLGEVHRVLTADGVFLMQDIAASSYLEKNLDHPMGTFLYTISTMHCMTVSLAQGGAGLGTAWGEELALKMLADAGFDDVTVQRLPHDILNNYYTMRKT